MTLKDILETVDDEVLITVFVPENNIKRNKPIPVITSSTHMEINNTLSLYLNSELFNLEVKTIKTRSMGPNNCGSELLVMLKEMLV